MWKTKWAKCEEEVGAELPTTTGGDDPADSSTEESVNWSDMADGLLLDDAGTVEGEHEVIEPVETPVETPVEQPAPIAAEAQPVAPAPVTPPTEPQTSPAPQSQAMPAAAPEDYQAWRNTRLEQLEQQYGVSDDDAVSLLTEPEKVLPKLAARVHMEVLESSMRAMQAMMPVMMTQLQSHNEANTSAKNLFLSVNPDLADSRYEPAIMQLGQVYRNVNKTASPDEAARAIGALVRSALGIAAPQAAAPQAAPAAPVPFSPARGGGSGRAPLAPSNPFEALAMEMLNDDD